MLGGAPVHHGDGVMEEQEILGMGGTPGVDLVPSWDGLNRDIDWVVGKRRDSAAGCETAMKFGPRWKARCVEGVLGSAILTQFGDLGLRCFPMFLFFAKSTFLVFGISRTPMFSDILMF
jgi:hypothetical protein